MPRVAYFAPGSGLGHVNRALAVCLELRDLGVESEIVCSSPFAEGAARAAEFPIVQISRERWSEWAPAYLRERRPALAVTDTFPAGIDGEWGVESATPFVYVARRLRLERYPYRHWIRFTGVVQIEALSGDHERAIAENGSPVVRLPGPIRLARGRIRTPVPAELSRWLERSSLVVHSGPVEEVRTLVAAAGGDAVVVSPWEVGYGVPRFDYFPAGNLMGAARRVITGAGYNSMADWASETAQQVEACLTLHTAIAFERRYDDQAARLASWQAAGDGTVEAARLIAALSCQV